MKKGGSAKGELVLAMFELANSFRNGWGVKKDPVAAKQYYETAANLGDTDAMNEVAWCYLEGFGCKKDKVSIATLATGASRGRDNTPPATVLVDLVASDLMYAGPRHRWHAWGTGTLPGDMHLGV